MIKIGMVGTHQLSFPGEKENLYKRMREQMRKNASEMGFELYAYEKLVVTEEEALARAPRAGRGES